jgi:hypothetical protein
MQSYSVKAILQAFEANRTLIKQFWSDYSLGRITIDDLLPADDIREYGRGKPCACCGKTMTRDKWSLIPMNGWLQEDGWWKNPRNVTIDHRYPKSLFPELMFDPDNMELMCHACNQDKGDLFGQTISKDCKDYATRFRSKML